ncbi:oxygen-independent coproporphyrinogen III oxidase [Sansalvadorimonas sp. 2012CJ34-2]|uniref:Coproporphyrinogen-III oxidase n=1 Tax=Parendozoicomonas callyspongiae TaxID=2942213 RepID=A0ABT0PHZ5_9GAMM|nr:oxygen-independent coproporphyrinogen III oxidase [Sansalvadorimonas sp. 2012CJ34-2]MCL6271002.1 oxygen-independent coproporphyrinogen III oxidase [Sansalvadorimonas sp. 2012CJ34-2]
MNNSLIWDTSLIRRYDQPGPRYTSYPTAVQFTGDFDQSLYNKAVASRDPSKPLSLYFHIPFCDTVCYYCGCNKIVTKHRSKAEPYLELLIQEMAMQSELFGRHAPVQQLHLGGGTPTFLNDDQMKQLMHAAEKYFRLVHDDDSDYSIEIDPREADWSTMGALRELGFNRISLGVQDFDVRVQTAVNRIQPISLTEDLIDASRALNFKSINLDLIYGLPFQSVSSFMNTVEKVIQLHPDRLSVFNYAHLPHRFKPQRRINSNDLPSPAEKLRMMEETTARLLDAGYVYIGMDHFALPDDDLAMAQEEGVLHRNFQGYTTHGHCDLIAMGVSSISQVGNVFAQNFPDMDNYTQRINNGQLPTYRGLQSTDEDMMRSHVIRRLICDFKLDFHSLENDLDINFLDTFRPELEQLKVMQEDGLLELDEQSLKVLPRGRLLIRNICMVFDQYLKAQTEQRFSRVI